MTEYSLLLSRQADFFNSGQTLDVKFRKQQLGILYNAIKSNEEKLLDALHKDLRKNKFEAYATELGIVLNEISFIQKRLSRWVKARKVKTPLVQFNSKSFVYPEPYGQSLIFSTWNYPVQMVLAPLAGSIAAGNTVIVKPSEFSVATSKVLKDILNDTFPEDYIACVNGGVETGQALLELPFHHIFFTGSSRIGKIVMKKAAENLTPLTLELGGKNPCIVDETANIELAAKRIAWGKFMNAGQTCISPDYLFVHEKIAMPFLEKLTEYIRKFYGDDPQQNANYGRIINALNFNRLSDLIENNEIYFGGKRNAEDLYFGPTLVLNPPLESSLMKDEIFGPILPVTFFKDSTEVIKLAKNGHKPLSMYIFSSSRKARNYFLQNIQSGNGAINDTLTQLANPHLPFGGVNSSGMGAYHGKHSFLNFSHQRSIIKTSTLFDLPLAYPPYSTLAQKAIRFFLS